MSNKFYMICLVLMLTTLGISAVIYSRPIPVVVQTNLEKLPLMIAGYTATEDAFSDSVYTELNADKHVYRHYKSQHGDIINLYIGYYGTAKGGRTGHNPYACLPGSGAAIIDRNVVYLKQAASGKRVPVNYTLSRKDGINTVMLHWYQTAGKTVVSTGLMHNIERFKGRVLHNRNDGAFIQLTASTIQDVLTTQKKVQEFSELVLNLLPQYWPIEK